MKNNPFKMWESWIGLVLGFYLPTWFYKLQLFYTMPLQAPFYAIDTIYTFEQFLSNIVFSSVIGFFIGWGIGILLRRR